MSDIAYTSPYSLDAAYDDAHTSARRAGRHAARDYHAELDKLSGRDRSRAGGRGNALTTRPMGEADSTGDSDAWHVRGEGTSQGRAASHPAEGDSALEEQLADTENMLIECRRQIDALQREVRNVVRENYRLMDEKKAVIDEGRTKKDWDELHELTRTVIEENEVLHDTHTRQHQEILRLEALLGKKREEVQDAHEKLQSRGSLDKQAKAELGRLRDENSRLMRENARLKAESEMSTEAVGGSTTVLEKEQQQKIIHDLTSTHLREIATLEAKFSRIQEDAREREKEHTAMAARHQESKSLVNALRDRMDSARQENSRLHQRVADLELALETAVREKEQYLSHLDAVVKVADRRQQQLQQLATDTRKSKVERDRALMEAARRDAKLESISQQLFKEQQTARAQLLDAVDLVRQQRAKAKLYESHSSYRY